MNGELLVKWLTEKRDILKNETPDHLTDRPVGRAMLRGGIKAIEEIIDRVREGKFDKYYECKNGETCEYQMQVNLHLEHKCTICRGGNATEACSWKGELINI